MFKSPGISIPGVGTGTLLGALSRVLSPITLIFIPSELADAELLDPDVLQRLRNLPKDTEELACPKPGGRDPCKGLRDTLRDHLDKLNAYMRNPYDPNSDNQNLLRDNPVSRHKSIISGRINKLLGQVENFRRLLEECERRNGLR